MKEYAHCIATPPGDPTWQLTSHVDPGIVISLDIRAFLRCPGIMAVQSAEDASCISCGQKQVKH